MIVGTVEAMADSPIPEQPIVREVVLDVQLPRINPTERVQVRRIRMLPGYRAGLHLHNGPVVGSIFEGSLIYQVEGEPQSVLHPGDVFYEPEGARIARLQICCLRSLARSGLSNQLDPYVPACDARSEFARPVGDRS